MWPSKAVAQEGVRWSLRRRCSDWTAALTWMPCCPRRSLVIFVSVIVFKTSKDQLHILSCNPPFNCGNLYMVVWYNYKEIMQELENARFWNGARYLPSSQIRKSDPPLQGSHTGSYWEGHKREIWGPKQDYSPPAAEYWGQPASTTNNSLQLTWLYVVQRWQVVLAKWVGWRILRVCDIPVEKYFFIE